MGWELRTIAFLVELLHPPVPQTPESLQKLHGELFSGGDATYLNFAITPGGATLSNPPQSAGQVHATIYLPDRVQIREEKIGSTVEEFCERMEEVLRATFHHLPLPLLTGQQVTVRSLVSPPGMRDTRTFLSRSLLRLDPAALEILGRDANLYGIRLAFPQTPEDPDLFQLRIESYTADPRSIFLEATGMFPVIVNEETLGLAGRNVQTVYEFLEKKAMTFLQAFPHEEPGP